MFHLKYCVFQFILFYSLQFNGILSLKVLIVAPALSGSHVMFNYRLAETIAEYGHTAAVWLQLDKSTIIPESSLKPPTGVHVHIFLYDPASNLTTQAMINTFTFREIAFSEYRKIGAAWRTIFSNMCWQHFDKSVDLIQKLKAEQFDLMLTENFDLCPLGLAYKMNIHKSMWVSPGAFIADFSANVLGLPHVPSVVPTTLSPYSDHMSFLQRSKNAMITVLTILYIYCFPNALHDQSKYFTEPPYDDYPTLFSLAERVPTVFINGESFLDFPRPLPSGVNHLGSLANPNMPIKAEFEGDLKSICEKHTNGLILFSFGTLARASDMPADMKMAYINAFANFPEYTIIWRFEEDILEAKKYQHIHVLSWIPQRQLLNHPRTKLFITHGGYNSLLEAATAGVPMVLIPLFGDQTGNSMRAVRHGLGKRLDKLKASNETLSAAMNAVLYHPRYAANARRMSAMLKDKVMDSSDLFIYQLTFLNKHWTRFPTLAAGRRLNFIQYHCFDVIALLLLAFAFGVYFVYQLVSKISQFVKGEGANSMTLKNKIE